MSHVTTRRGWTYRSVLAAIAVLAALLVTLSSALASGLAAGDSAQGKTLFQTNCAACHLATGAGGVKVGEATAPDIRWSAIGGAFKDANLLSRAIVQGLDEEGKALDPAMPRFQGKLTDAQVADVAAYVMTLNAPAAAPTEMPKTGDPLGAQSLPWLAAAAGLLALGGLSIRRLARGQS